MLNAFRLFLIFFETGPIQPYVGYTGASKFQGSVRVTEKFAGVVTELTPIAGGLADPTSTPTGTVTVVETIDGKVIYFYFGNYNIFQFLIKYD